MAALPRKMGAEVATALDLQVRARESFSSLAAAGVLAVKGPTKSLHVQLNNKKDLYAN